MPKAVLRNGTRIHYQQIGEGPDVVMIHGLMGNVAVWHLKIIPLLFDRYRILTYDLRGHGYSDMTPTGYTPDDMAEDLCELLDVVGVERPSLVGHSFGADVALYFALHNPERVDRIIGIEPGVPALAHERSDHSWSGWDFWAGLLERLGATVPEDRRYDVDYLLRTSFEVPKMWGPLKGMPRNSKGLLKLMETTDVVKESHTVGNLTLERIPEIETPTILMYDQSSSFLRCYEYLMEHLPNVTGILLPETDWGHFAPLDQPELVAQYLLEFLPAPAKPALYGAVSAP